MRPLPTPTHSRRRLGAWLLRPGLLLLAVLVLWQSGPLAFRQPAPLPTARATPAATLPPLTSAEAYFTRADASYDAGDYTNAIADYGRAIELKPDWPAPYNNRAYTEMKLEDYAPALADLNEAIRLRPDYVNALLNRGDIYNYYYDIDYDLAIADYDRAIASDPSIRDSTSVCGHRAVASLRGNSIGFPVLLLTHAVNAQANCPNPNPDE